MVEVTVRCPICKKMLQINIPKGPVADRAKEHTLATLVIVHGTHSFIMYVDENWMVRGITGTDATIFIPKEEEN